MAGDLFFTSIDWQRVAGRGDRAVILCDEDRPRGLAFLVGAKVRIDGAFYVVDSAEHPRLAGPIRRGDHVVVWVRPHFEAQMPNTNQRGNA